MSTLYNKQMKWDVKFLSTQQQQKQQGSNHRRISNNVQVSYNEFKIGIFV